VDPDYTADPADQAVACYSRSKPRRDATGVSVVRVRPGGVIFLCKNAFRRNVPGTCRPACYASMIHERWREVVGLHIKLHRQWLADRRVKLVPSRHAVRVSVVRVRTGGIGLLGQRAVCRNRAKRHRLAYDAPVIQECRRDVVGLHKASIV